MTDSAYKFRLADLLERVAEGTLRPIDALREVEKWEDLPYWKREVAEALDILMRFHADADLRDKDPEYDEGMRHGLRLQISNLRSA